MLIKLTLISSTTLVKAQTIASYIESSGINTYIQNTDPSDPEDANKEQTSNVFVNETDYTTALNLLHKYNPETTSGTIVPDEQYFPSLIIVPLDFSSASENACYYALELANKFHSRIKLIHTYGIPDLGPFIMEEGEFYQNTLNNQIVEIREQIEAKHAELEKKLENYIKSKSLSDIPITKLLIYGLLDEITLYSADVDKANLIVTGIQNENSLSFSTSNKLVNRIIDKSNIPVLIIPEENNHDGIDKIKNILYLTTFDESDFSAIQRLITIDKNNKLNIFCLHIQGGTINPWDKIKMNGLKEYFKSSYNLNNVTCDLVSSDDMISTLDKFIKKNSIDIITVFNHKRSSLSKLINPGITKKILFHTHIPLLVFRD